METNSDMKKIFLLALPLMAMCIVSCNREEINITAGAEDTPQSVGEAVKVSFAFKGDITIEESPLLKAAGEETESTDLYGINVYYDRKQDGRINDVYGFGLFDNIADMNISLLTGYKYKFECSLVKDGKNKVAYNNNKFYYNSYYCYTEGYCMPFCIDYNEYDIQPTPVTNEFILGRYDIHLVGLGMGRTNNFKAEDNTIIYGSTESYSDGGEIGNGGYRRYPETDRYYGETTDYVPTEGGVVSIEMKRCVFGMKLNVTGVTDGSLSINIYDEDGIIFSFDDISADMSIEKAIVTFDDIYQCWNEAMCSNTYYRDMEIEVYWYRGNGILQTLGTQQVSFKRNVLTTINININGSSEDNMINFNIESGEMLEENVDMNIDADDMEETPVEPTE